MYLTDIQDYNEALAISHADVRHNENGQRAFFRLQGFGALPQLPNNLGPVFIQMERFGGRAIGEYDAHKLQQFITIRFNKLLDIPPDGDFEAAISTCMGDCYLIMMDWISKMKKDFADDSCGWLQHVDFQGLNWSEYDGPLLDNYFGWDLTIPFKASFPAYRAAKWL